MANKKRKIATVTVARSDYGLYTPVWDAIQDHPDLELQVIVAAAHLSPTFGNTIDLIRQDNYPIIGEVKMTLDTDDPHAINQSIAVGTQGFSKIYKDQDIDILLLLGDRFEMHAAAVAAVPHLIPIAHIHGGEETTGAIDNLYRHSITKLSHIHFASTELHAKRIIQMGENPAYVHISGAPAIDRILQNTPPEKKELEDKIGHTLPSEFIVATFHPVTTEPKDAKQQAEAFLTAIKEFGMTTLLTMPNADTGGRAVRAAIKEFAPTFPKLIAVENLGQKLYLAAMHHATLMAGNSSSGIIEAASFNLPVVNIGNRQEGRAQSGNVINCEPTLQSILQALQKANSTEQKQTAANSQNIYGQGKAAQIITHQLATVPLSTEFVKKTFQDLDFVPSKITGRKI